MKTLRDWLAVFVSMIVIFSAAIGAIVWIESNAVSAIGKAVDDKLEGIGKSL